MALTRYIIFVLKMLLAAPAVAMSVAPVSVSAPTPGGLVRTQNDDIPDVVRLLAQRAARAERRGDTATARELYKAIRDLGYVVRPSESSRRGIRDDDKRPNRSTRSDRDRDDDDDDDDDADDDDDGDDNGGDEGDDDDD